MSRSAVYRLFDRFGAAVIALCMLLGTAVYTVSAEGEEPAEEESRSEIISFDLTGIPEEADDITLLPEELPSTVN